MQNYHVISEPDPPKEIAPTESAMPEVKTPSETLPLGEVHFSLDPDGIYLSPQTLVLSSDSPDATIRYALNDDILNGEMTLFDPTQPITLTQSTQIAAQVFKGEEVGPIKVVEYTIKTAVWQKREPEDQSDPTPHEIHETATLTENWNLAASSVRGKLHAHRGLWREDSFSWGQSGDWTIAVVSDGAGSAPLSRVGSALACQTVKRYLETALVNYHLGDNEAALKEQDVPQVRTTLANAAQAALETLQNEAAQRQRSLSDFAATLLILVKTSWQTGNFLAALQVGDGAIALYSSHGELRLLGVADHGEHSSETRFLTTRNIEAEFQSRVTCLVQRDVRAIALMSDGISDDFFPEDKRLGELFEALLPRLDTAEDTGAIVLDWLGYEKKGSSDDRTLMVLWQPADSATKSSEGDLAK